MNSSTKITLYHAPNTRSTGVLTLLQELDVDYDIHLLRFATNDHKSAEYLAINPMGKVPAIKHGDAVVTEQVAIYLYLADLYQDKGLAPALDDPRRGEYLRWMVFYGSCFEPAIIDKSSQVLHSSKTACPYGDFDTMLNTVLGQLKKHDYIAGDKFTAADILWGSSLGWIMQFKLVDETPELLAYVKRITGRESFAKSNKIDQDYTADDDV
ncbi:glutathione S-transferase family protein [Aliiglaciecola litoralis]|uniref:Glutathione S-transferase family protein n=1 Tax=Aliiglaciecola litoralis TaxID=582857 RepID=A0ABN1LJ49_9ALTE